MITTPSKAQVPAAAQVLAILRFMGAQAAPVGASTISRELELPRSTTYHLLAALINDGFIAHLPEERKYALGVTAHELSTGYARQAPLQRMARYPMVKLVARTRRTAHLAVMHGREVIYVIEERAPRQRRLVTDAGVRLPAHLTASGRAMLAAMDASQVAALYPGTDSFITRNTAGPHSLHELMELLLKIREAGYSWEQDEITEGFSSVAVAVLDRTKYPIASVTLTVSNRVPSARVGASERSVHLEELVQTWVPEVTRCAREISRRLSPTG